MAVGYAVPDAAPWLLTFAAATNPLRDATSVGVEAIDWIRVSPRSARPARETSLFGKSALEADRDEKARSVVALSRVPRLAGFTGSLRLPAIKDGSQASCPDPVHRHTTTGTCDLGKRKHRRIRPLHKCFLRLKIDFPTMPRRVAKMARGFQISLRIADADHAFRASAAGARSKLDHA